MLMDLREYALKALDTAKEDLCRDKYLIPVAFIVTDEEVLDFNLQFEDAEQKILVYRELVDIANEKCARAIITLNDARVTDRTGGAGGYAVYTPTPSGRGEERECIYVTVSGPSIQTWTLCLPYERVGDKIVFGEPSETFNDLLNLLPGWPIEEARRGPS
jgi:hypothetical protein